MSKNLYVNICAAISLCLIFLLGCSSRELIISKKGLSYGKIGSIMPPIGTEKLGKFSVKDSIFYDEDVSWRVVKVDHKKGAVFLEEDFFGGDLLNRIRIESPNLKLKDGLCVGKKLSDLKEKTDRWYISSIASYNVFDFYSDLYPRTHFIVSDPNVPKDKDWESYHIKQFDPEGKVKMIILF